MRTGSTVIVRSAFKRKVYAQRKPRPIRNSWSDKVIEGDDVYGTIPDGTPCLYMGSERISHLLPGESPNEVRWLLYHLLLWGSRAVWVSDEKCFLDEER